MNVNCTKGKPCLGYDESIQVAGFNAFRDKPAPTSYAAHPTAVSYDITLAGLICAAVILFISFLIVLPGIRGIQRLYAFIRMTVSLFIGLTILLCLHGVDWETDSVTVDHIAYKPFTRYEISATIGLHIGLRELNITLKGNPIEQTSEENQNETIDYNEQYVLCCGQGRTGFGPFAGRINRDFRAAEWRGTPLPILWVLEYFTLDGDNIRWGRAYRASGWYTNILLWTSFPLWLLSNMLFFMVVRFGAYFLCLTGSCMLAANIIFASFRNSLGGEEDFFWIPLKIPLGDAELHLSYGWCFWMNLSVGLMCVILSFVIYTIDEINPIAMASFFNVDPLQDFQDQIVPVKEHSDNGNPVSFHIGDTDESIPEEAQEANPKHDDQPIYENRMVFRPKRRTIFAKSFQRVPPPMPRGHQNHGMDTLNETVVENGDGIHTEMAANVTEESKF